MLGTPIAAGLAAGRRTGRARQGAATGACAGAAAALVVSVLGTGAAALLPHEARLLYWAYPVRHLAHGALYRYEVNVSQGAAAYIFVLLFFPLLGAGLANLGALIAVGQPSQRPGGGNGGGPPPPPPSSAASQRRPGLGHPHPATHPARRSLHHAPRRTGRFPRLRKRARSAQSRRADPHYRQPSLAQPDSSARPRHARGASGRRPARRPRPGQRLHGRSSRHGHRGRRRHRPPAPRSSTRRAPAGLARREPVRAATSAWRGPLVMTNVRPPATARPLASTPRSLVRPVCWCCSRTARRFATARGPERHRGSRRRPGWQPS